jgi:hypothetical protein
MADDDLLTYKEAAAYCRYKSIKPLRAAVRRRELQAIRPSYNRVVFFKSEIKRWLSTKKKRIIPCSASQSKLSPPSSPSALDGSVALSTNGIETDES